MINPQILNPQIFFMSQSANSKPQIWKEKGSVSDPDTM